MKQFLLGVFFSIEKSRFGTGNLESPLAGHSYHHRLFQAKFSNCLLSGLMAIGFLMFNFVDTKGQASPGNPTFTTVPVTQGVYGEPYTYGIIATQEGGLETSIDARILPDWLSFRIEGQKEATLWGNIPAGVSLSGVAGDEQGNLYAITRDGTEIFIIAPDGTTASWKTGLISGSIYGLHISNGYLYIPRHSNSSNSITRVPLNDPNRAEEIFASLPGGALSLTDKDGFIYASDYSNGMIYKIEESSKTASVFIGDGLPTIGPFGLSFDGKGNLFIATFGHSSIMRYDGTNLTTVLSGLPHSVSSVCLDGMGNFYISMSGGGIRKYNSNFSSYSYVSPGVTDNVWSLSFTSHGAIVYSKFGSNEVYRLQTGATLFGTPAKTDVGTHEVVLRATNTAGYSEQAFLIKVEDKVPPVISSLNPADKGSLVDLQPTMALSFDEEVILGGSGFLWIYDGNDPVMGFDLSLQGDREKLNLSPDQMTLNVEIGENLPVNTTLSVEITPGFVRDAHENDFAGFSAASNTWTFTTRDKLEQILAFPEPEEKTYGDDPFTLGEKTSSAGLTVTYTAEDPSVIRISGNQAIILKAGNTKITASQQGDEITFTAEPVERTMTVNKKVLTVRANDFIKIYDGQAYSDPSVVFNGFAENDDKTVLGGELVYMGNGVGKKDAGKYTIMPGGLTSENYEIAFIGGNLQITKASLTITAFDQSTVYSEPIPTLTIYYSGLVDGDTQTQIQPLISTIASSGSVVGIYPIMVEGAEDPNYAIQNIEGQLEVTKAKLTLRAEAKSKVYGQSNPPLTFLYEGLVNGDTRISREPTISTTANQNSQVGNYPLNLENAEDPNYFIHYEAGELTILPAELIVKAEDKSKLYGEENPVLTYTYLGLVNGDLSISKEPSLSTTAAMGSSVGQYGIKLSGAADDNYVITTQEGTLTVGKKQLIIRAEDQSKLYGEPNPTLTFTYTGLVNGDAQTDTEPGLSTTVNENSGAGKYPIIAAGAEDVNYDITYQQGTFTIGKKVLLIIAEDKSKIYGEKNPILTFTYSGLENGDTKIATQPSLSTTAKAGSSVGTYGIVLSGAADRNYEITYKNGTLKIGKKALTIRADNKSKSYGEDVPELTLTYSGLVNRDTETATVANLSTTATANSPIGRYDIRIEKAVDENYAITYKQGSLTVAKINLLITAEDKSKIYGEENPMMTFTYTGLANGDTQTSTLPNISTEASTNSNAGSYPIEISGAADGNYHIVYQNSTLTIDKKPLTIIAGNESKTYGEENPTFTYTYKGLEIGDTKIAIEPSIGTTATADSEVGTYTIEIAKGSDANYEIEYQNGTFKIGKKELLITAEDKSRLYGLANPPLTYTYTGLVNGETKIATVPSLSTTATAGSSVGPYEIELSGASDKNYEIAYQNGTLKIDRKSLLIRAEDKSRSYGEDNPALTFTYTGLENGDTQTFIAPRISTTAIGSSSIGTYEIKVEGAEDVNYAITYGHGILTVGRKNLLITAEDKTRTYGEENPLLTFTYTGLANEDTQTSTEPRLSTRATSTSNAGSHPIEISGAMDENYDIEFLSGTLRVDKKALTVKAEDRSKIYGESDPGNSVIYKGFVNSEEAGSLSGGLLYTRQVGENVGAYTITPSGLQSPNYSFSYEPGTLQILPKRLIVKASDGQFKFFREVDPEFAYEASGFERNDDLALMTGILARESGEAVGRYPFTLGSLVVGINYQVEFISSTYEIKTTILADIINPLTHEIAWGTALNDFGLPTTLQVMTENADLISMRVVWEENNIDSFKSGSSNITGNLVPEPGIVIPNGLNPVIAVSILPKPAPEDFVLDNDVFEADAKAQFFPIGRFIVEDKTDNIHFIGLLEDSHDNRYFEIKDNLLYWNSSDRAEGDRIFTILVKLTDREGNELVKTFEISRNRTAMEAIEVFNTFSPNGDGLNDSWGVPDLQFYTGGRVMVFERSGKRVFYTENPSERWDGTFQGKDVPVGSYFWIIESGETGEVRRGVLNLIRK